MCREARGKRLDPLRLAALGSVHVEWQSDDEPTRLVGGDERADRVEIARPTDAPHDPDAPDREPELVAHGDADARIADVERRQSHGDVVTSAGWEGQSTRGESLLDRAFH